MIHKLLAGKGRMKKGLSLLLCLALLGSSVISANVTAEAESGVTVETDENNETDEAEETETADEAEATADEMVEEVAETETTEGSGTAEITDEIAEAENAEETEATDEEDTTTSEEATVSSKTEETVSVSEEVDTETVEEEADQDGAGTTTEAEAEEIVTETEETPIVTAASVSSSATVSTTATTADDSVDSSDEENVSEMPAITLKDSTDDVNVSVNAPEGAFAEGVSMVVSAADTDVFLAAVTADIEKEGGTCTVYDSVVVEISFYNANGEEVEPASAVEVTLGNLNLSMGDNDLTKYAIIYHMDDEGNVDWITDGDEVGASSYTFSATSFSTYGVVIASVEYGTSLTAPNSQKECDQANYSANPKVYYDTFSVTSTNNGKITGGMVDTDARNYISSVTLSGITVKQADSNTTNWSGGSTVGTYFSGATTSNEVEATLVITPKTGYYVTAVVIACTSGENNESPYQCDTWSEGNAYNTSFSVGTSGAVTVTVSSEDFSHYSNTKSSTNNNYFILIAVSPVPSPLYVEYDYGNIVTYIGDGDSSAFNTSTGWTVTSSGNYYGDGYSDSNDDITYTNTDGTTTYTGYGVMTDDTQYKYAYTKGGTVTAANWVHYANTITTEAKEQAAAAGYVFAGWKIEYYTSVSVAKNADQEITGNQSNYNNWDYVFTNSYGGGAIYSEGQTVTLTTNARLVAQWIPIGIQIEKTVSGLPSTLSDTYTIVLQKYNDDTSMWETVSTYTAKDLFGGSTSTSSVIYPISSGLYRVVETSENGSQSDGTTTYYLVSATGDTTTITVPEEKVEGAGDYEVQDVDGTEVAVLDTLTFTNTYSETQEYIMVEKTFVGIDSVPNNFKITVSSDALDNDVELTANNRETDLDEVDEEENTITWKWKVYISDTTATYSYSENKDSAKVDGYNLEVTNGSGSATVTAAKFDVTKVEYEKTCSHKDWPVNISGDTSTFFAASLTKNRGCVVVSATALSASQKKTIETAVVALGGVWKTPVYFYSLDIDGASFEVPGGTTITYDSETSKIILSDTSDWQHVATLSYSITAADNPEISITNTYTPDTTTLTVNKSVTGNMGDTTKDFDFTLTLTKVETDPYTVDLDGTKTLADRTENETTLQYNDTAVSYSFTLKDSESITITVPVGYTYTLTESNANGYTTSIYTNGSSEASESKIASGVLTASSETVDYVNNYDIDPETGLSLDSLPYILMLAGVAVLGGVVLFGRRRRLL